MLLRKVGQMGVATSFGPDGLRATVGRPAGVGRRGDAALPGRGHRLLAAAGGDAHGRRRGGDPDGEPVLGPLPLRRGAAAHGRRHPDRGASRGGPRRAEALGRGGAGPRHPGRRGAGAGRAGGRRRDRGGRRAPHRAGLRGPGRFAAGARRTGDRAGEPVVVGVTARRSRPAGARPPLPTEPAALLELARSGDRVALARLLSYIERGGDDRDRGGGARLPRRHAVHARARRARRGRGSRR